MKWKNQITGVEYELASGYCGKCGDFLESRWPGDFVSCNCHASFVDTCRWMPAIHRYGGAVTQEKQNTTNPTKIGR